MSEEETGPGTGTLAIGEYHPAAVTVGWCRLLSDLRPRGGMRGPAIDGDAVSAASVPLAQDIQFKSLGAVVGVAPRQRLNYDNSCASEHVITRLRLLLTFLGLFLPS